MIDLENKIVLFIKGFVRGHTRVLRNSRVVVIPANFRKEPVRPASAAQNIKAGCKAMDHALLAKTDVHHAMYRADTGWIDFLWGHVGKPPRKSGKRDEAFGIVHILESRMRKDGMTFNASKELLYSIVGAIANGRRVADDKTENGRRIILNHAGYEVVLIRPSGENAWLLSGYEKTKPV